jgi:chromatin segregation and condensation protein Rec8/ScpA/Scc1 (kleisin family)
VLGALEGGRRVEFMELFENLHDRPVVIATFMALLELIRRGDVAVWQEERMGPIMLERRIRRAEPQPEPERGGA